MVVELDETRIDRPIGTSDRDAVESSGRGIGRVLHCCDFGIADVDDSVIDDAACRIHGDDASAERQRRAGVRIDRCWHAFPQSATSRIQAWLSTLKEISGRGK